MSLKSITLYIWHRFHATCELLKPIGDLFIRYWVASAFFQSGLVKLQSWNTTILLFQYEYSVPLLSPETAAVLAAFIELVMSSLLFLGLGGRIAALILFIFNIAAISCYTFLLTPEGSVGLKDHICWGLLLMVLILHGPGKFSLDNLIVWLYKRKQI